MKKIFDSIRRGLIKLLGGYTGEPKKYVIEHIDVNPIMVQAVVTIPHMYVKDSTEQEYLMNSFMHALGEEIRKHEDLYKVYESYNPLTDEDIYKIVVKLLPVNN